MGRCSTAPAPAINHGGRQAMVNVDIGRHIVDVDIVGIGARVQLSLRSRQRGRRNLHLLLVLLLLLAMMLLLMMLNVCCWMKRWVVG